MHMPRIGDRQLFPDLKPDIYLNHAAISPISDPVKTAIGEVATAYAEEGVGCVMRWIEQRERLREKLAEFIGSSHERIGLIQNTTTGVVDIANSLIWQAGDKVVLFTNEFPANVTPWLQAAKTFDLQIEFVDVVETVESGGENLDVLDGARLVAASAVQFQTGWAMPLKAIGERCKENGCLFFVDGVQAVGAVDIDVATLGIDFLAVGGHKWMMSVEGAGFLYVSERGQSALTPRLVGWLSQEDSLSFLFEGAGLLDYDKPYKQSPELFEFGAVSALGYAAMEASLDLLMALGVSNIEAHITAYLTQLDEGFREIGWETTRKTDRSGILSVPIPNGDALNAAAKHFADHSIAVSTPDGHLRFAPHWPNAISEIDQILSAAQGVSR